MPDSFGPFGDRPWAEAEWYGFAQAWAPDGILVPGDLNLTTSGRTATIGTGRAWVGGAGFERTSPVDSVTVPANTHSTYSRRDRIVVRRSLTPANRGIRVITGTAAASPVAPDLKRDTRGDWDLPLWSFLTPPNSGSTLTGIVDERVQSITRQLMSGSSLPSYAPDGAIFFLTT